MNCKTEAILSTALFATLCLVCAFLWSILFCAEPNWQVEARPSYQVFIITWIVLLSSVGGWTIHAWWEHLRRL